MFVALCSNAAQETGWWTEKQGIHRQDMWRIIGEFESKAYYLYLFLVGLVLSTSNSTAQIYH